MAQKDTWFPHRGCVEVVGHCGDDGEVEALGSPAGHRNVARRCVKRHILFFLNKNENQIKTFLFACPEPVWINHRVVFLRKFETAGHLLLYIHIYTYIYI
jgi:hypothetical protein